MLKRAKQVKNRPILLNLSALYSRVDEMIHDYAYREVIIDANRLLNSSFDETMRETFGAEWIGKLREWVSDVAAGDSGPMDATDQVLNFVRRGKTASVMGLNLFNTVQNLTGMANSWERIGGKWLASGIQQFASRPLEQIKRVYAMSSFMRNRARTSMMTLNEVRNVVQGESRTMRQVEIAAYYLTLQSQRVVDMCTWLGQYSKMIAEGKTEEQAIALSDQAVIDAQGSGMTKDLAAVMRGSGKKKILTMFYSFFNSTYNMISVKQMTSRDAADIAATYFRVIVVPATLSYMLKQLLKPSVDDEEKDLSEIARELAGENLSYLMNTVIGLRELAPLAQSVFDSDNRPLTYGGPAVFGAIGDGYRFMNQVRQGELDAGFRRAFLSILGWGTGLPTAQLNRTIDGLTAIYEGKTVSPLAPVFGTRR